MKKPVADLLKPGRSQNDPKPAEMTQNQQKLPKILQTTRNNINFQNWGNLEFCTGFCFSNFKPKAKKH